jgi:hypothetical protein
MSSYTATYKQSVLNEARATLRRTDPTIRREWPTGGDAELPQPDALERHRRQRLASQEPEKPQRKLDTADVDWQAVIDQRLTAERELARHVLAETIVTLRAERDAAIAAAKAPLQRELAELRVSLTKSLQDELDQLRRMQATLTELQRLKGDDRLELAALRNTVADLKLTLAGERVGRTFDAAALQSTKELN